MPQRLPREKQLQHTLTRDCVTRRQVQAAPAARGYIPENKQPEAMVIGDAQQLSNRLGAALKERPRKLTWPTPMSFYSVWPESLLATPKKQCRDHLAQRR